MTVDLEATVHDAKTSATGSLAELPQFWNHDKVPDSDSEEFKQWILRNPECEKEGGEDQAGKVFTPRDEHCGIWNSSPNSDCHASFGDQGTTASVSCYGDLIQMSRFLGAGHSGMFSMDHQTTREPWEVHGRALDLDALSQNLGEEFTYDLHLSIEFCPKQLPQVKWVNWRWPRYEFDTKLPNVRAFFQWIVHDGAVLQQFVIENLGDQPVNFKHRFYRDMWVRDLDYLEPAYHFNDGEEGYTRVPGPNGYGHVCVHTLEKDDIADYTKSIPKAAAEAQLSGPKRVEIVDTNKVVEIPLSNDEAHAQARNETSGGNIKPAEKTDQFHTKPGSVAALITLFVNGKAIKFLDDQELWYEHQVEANRIDSNGTVPGTLEIVVAYKMILLPDNEVDWRNFLVPAREADVSRILRGETQRLWGDRDTEISSLCSLGLSFANQSPEQPDVEIEDMSNVTNEGKETPRYQHNAEKDRTEADMTVNEGNGDAVSSKKVDDCTDVPDGGGNSGSKPTGPSMPSGLVERESSPKSHIEYLAWRHLEHILSVCTVPVLPTALIEDGSTRVETHSSASQRASGKEEPKSEDVLIALTCGDMSGHRICTSASYFTFQFLIEVAGRLAQDPTPIAYTQMLLKRIKLILLGHVRWLESLRMTDQPAGPETRRRLLKNGCFAANYWVTGELERAGKNSSWQPDDSITDTSFHVLKLVEYMNFCKKYDSSEEDGKKLAHRILGDVWVPWLHELDKLDRRASFAWPHALVEGVHKYRLADHFWIWKTLKALEDSGFLTHQTSTKTRGEEQHPRKDEGLKWMLHFGDPKGSNDSDDSDDSGAEDRHSKRVYEKFGKVTKRLLPGDTQRGMLQRFTTVNDTSGERMLAVTRSPRENRFLFHARDTALFYGQDCGFFLTGSSFEGLWANTIESQIHHNESQEVGWDNAIRFALGIVVGCRDVTLNKRTPEDLVKRCVNVLINSSSHNGFFHGQLDEATKEPRIFYTEEDRDFYYHAGFEINYILLTNARAIDQCFEVDVTTPSPRAKPTATMSLRDGGDELKRPAQPHDFEILTRTTAQLKAQALGNQHSRDRSNPLARQPEPDRHIDVSRRLNMKKVIPFNTLIDATKIIVIEEEWLYHFPSFFSAANIDITEQVNRCLDSLHSKEGEEDDTSILTSQPNSYTAGSVIKQELDGYRHVERKFRLPNGTKSVVLAAFVVDTPKQKHLGKREMKDMQSRSEPKPLNNYNLRWTLSNRRTAEKAKKRFIWLPCANAETALLCWVASPGQERAAISLFFDRHSRYEKYTWDDTTMVLNTWQTELHLSFYVLAHTLVPRYGGLPPGNNDEFPGDSSKEIRRASMGFRFDGDFFDRYWTCHYIECIPNMAPRLEWLFPFDSSGKRADKQWWQRKVLDLFLLDEILCHIAKSAIDILSEVRKELGVEESSLSFSILNSEAYSSSKDNWHRFEQILQAVEEDLTSTLHTLQKWNSRERDRGQEKPRWTRSDERKYRGAINKYQGSTERQTRDLGIHRDTIRKLKDTLATSSQKIRNDRELHRNENIRYFTYVTVIFLPLGFAASFYSMNGAPAPDLLISLVEFAAAAFAVTVALLASAKTLSLAVDVVLVPLRQMRSQAGLAIEKYSRSIMDESLLIKRSEKLKKSSEQTETRHPAPRQFRSWDIEHTSTQEPKRDLISPHRFWPEYIFVEIPARRVLLAIDELKGRDFSLQAFTNVLLGFIIFLPVFGISWLVRMIFLNIQDVGKTLMLIAKRLFPRRPAGLKIGNQDKADARLQRFERMTGVPKMSRPFQFIQEAITRKIESNKKEGPPPPPPPPFPSPPQLSRPPPPPPPPVLSGSNT